MAGKLEGRLEEKQATVSRLFKPNLPIEQITQAVELSIEEVQQIIAERSTIPVED